MSGEIKAVNFSGALRQVRILRDIHLSIHVPGNKGTLKRFFN